MVWHFVGNGSYSVKTDYHIILDHLNPNEIDPKLYNWSKLWHLNVLLKIRYFFMVCMQ